MKKIPSNTTSTNDPPQRIFKGKIQFIVQKRAWHLPKQQMGGACNKKLWTNTSYKGKTKSYSGYKFIIEKKQGHYSFLILDVCFDDG